MANFYDLDEFVLYEQYVINEAGQNKEYEKFFQDKLKEYGVESPADLSEEEKKKFFNEIKKEWK